MFNKFKTILKKLLITILVLVAILLIVGVLFINLSPEFGGSPSKANKAGYVKLGNYESGKFKNAIPTSMDMGFKNGIGVMLDFIKGVPNGKPSFKLSSKKIDSLSLTENKNISQIIWFGHSAFLLQINGKNILIDPMLGNVPAPHPWLGNKRFNYDLPIVLEKLPHIDLVIISHDHYDHLDYGSIKKLIPKTKAFYVPLGVAAHLTSWGVNEKSIHEFNWWEEKQLDDLKLVFTPARHFSGRGLSNRFSTLWGSWVISSTTENIFFSGDSGYGPHFKTIGDKYGPFDFAMMECGQYNENWSEIHMMPEETAQAAVDVNAKVMMPIHWGAFTLALHSWTDPIERVRLKATELEMPVTIPEIGQPIYLSDPIIHSRPWWRKN